MKKLLTVAMAVLVLALSVIPAFAVESPTAKPTNYVITFIDDEGVHGTATFVTEIGEDGTQKVIITAAVDSGYEFTGWTINGQYVPAGALTDNPLELTISSDLTVYTGGRKIGDTTPTGTGTTVPAPTKKTDSGDKSPQTGSQDYFVFIVLGLSAAALIAGVVVSKRRSSEK